MVVWLSRSDIESTDICDPINLVDTVEQTLRLHLEQKTVQPLKTYLRIPNDLESRRILTMPSLLNGDSKTWGVKIIGSCPSNPERRGLERASAIFVLHDYQTARPVALIEGALISASRTAAISLIASKYLAPVEPQLTLCVVGCGLIGSMTAKALSKFNDNIETIKLFDHSLDAATRLKTELAELCVKNTQVVAHDCLSNALSGSDIVLVCTTAQQGYIAARQVKDCRLFLNVSLRDPKECTVLSFDKIVVDDWSQANHGGTTLNKMVLSGALSKQDLFAELPELVSGNKLGRESKDEKIFFNPMGMGIEDLAVAQMVYDNAIVNQLGTALDYDN